MPRRWTNIQSAEQHIIQMREEGRTRQEIADVLGLEKVQIKNWINRYNRKQTKIFITSMPSKKRGRARKNPINELQTMALRIRELEREVELYRSFLHAAGRM